MLSWMIVARSWPIVSMKSSLPIVRHSVFVGINKGVLGYGLRFLRQIYRYGHVSCVCTLEIPNQISTPPQAP